MLNAIFMPGQTNITVNGLHQWDYGQQLQIVSDDIPAVIEVHFACVGMKEAIVRVCEVVNGQATVSIPDVCLEQAAPITAWIYEINESAGTTTKAITLPVIGRARPAVSEAVPEEIVDKYTQSITAITSLVGAFTSGAVTAGKAKTAEQANLATSALTAGTAGHATTAGTASSAGVAKDLEAKPLSILNTNKITTPGLYYVTVYTTETSSTTEETVFITLSILVRDLDKRICGTPYIAIEFTEKGTSHPVIYYLVREVDGTVNVCKRVFDCALVSQSTYPDNHVITPMFRIAQITNPEEK